MAAKRGLSASVLVNNFDLSTYLKNAAPSLDMELLDGTTFQAPGGDKVFITGFRDGKLSLEGFFDSDAVTLDQIDDVFNSVIGSQTKQVVTVSPEGALTLGNRCFLFDADTVSYKVSSPATDLIMSSAELQSSSGIGAGIILQVLASLTTTGNGASVDNGAASTRGGAGHLHVTVDNGTSLDVKIQHSTDDSVWVDLITFTNTGVVTAERVENTNTTGVAQVETATAAGTVSTAGNVTVTVTGAAISGSPVVVSVPVLLSDTANAIALAIRTALAANLAISSVYTVSGATSAIILTRNSLAANDATLNIAIADGTSVGVTAAPTSANTTAGVVGGAVYRYVRAIRTISGTSFTVMVAFTRL